VLVRHAKSVTGGAADSERPLAGRGVADAPAIGRWLAERALVPDRVVVSPARRARQTWELAGAELAAAPEPVLDERVYDNTGESLLAVLRETPAGVGTLVLVGHNPSMEQLALALDDGRGQAEARHALAQKYPTSAVAVFTVDGEWAAVGAGDGTLASFALPRG